MNLSDDQEGMAKDIVDFLVSWILSWHNKHPNSNVEPVEAQDAWTKLARMMGPHQRLLTHVYIEQNETTGQICLSTEDEGIEIESWALSCESLSDCIGPVSRKIETGSFEPYLEEDGADHEEEEEDKCPVSQKSGVSGVVPAHSSFRPNETTATTTDASYPNEHHTSGNSTQSNNPLLVSAE